MTKLQSSTKTNEVKMESLEEAQAIAKMVAKYGIKIFIKKSIDKPSNR